MAKKIDIIYVARDIERALGREPGAHGLSNYLIITNKSPYALEIQKKYPDSIWLINSPKILDTYELLMLPETQENLSKYDPQILVFKNTNHIEQLCKEKGWKLLNPRAVLSEKIENKITQVEWLDELTLLLPPHRISTVEKIEWKKKTLVLQWAHSHTGDGTLLIKNEKDLQELKDKFPHREVRITDFIRGPMFTVNVVATDKNILIGNISYQITGTLPFTENVFSTVGNDWSVPQTILTEDQLGEINSMAIRIGEKMKKDGWKGLFGIDVIYDEERDKISLIEINPRQPASTTYESELQKKNDPDGLTVFDAHLDTLLDLPVSIKLTLLNDGAQIIQRITSKSNGIDEGKLIRAGYKVIKYENVKLNADLLRIQSARGILETHNKFNKRGKEIIELL